MAIKYLFRPIPVFFKAGIWVKPTMLYIYIDHHPKYDRYRYNIYICYNICLGSVIAETIFRLAVGRCCPRHNRVVIKAKFIGSVPTKQKSVRGRNVLPSKSEQPFQICG